ncbi:MAG: hypothetical protein U0X93_08890 [Anaerolineales bacterium]
MKPLLKAGYFVVAYDQPAHGESDGAQTNLLKIAPTMDVMLNHHGEFDAISHSFGTLITSYALVKRNFPPLPSWFTSARSIGLDVLPRFQVIAKLPDELLDGLRDMFFENFATLWDSIVNEEFVKGINILP